MGVWAAAGVLLPLTAGRFDSINWAFFCWDGRLDFRPARRPGQKPSRSSSFAVPALVAAAVGRIPR
jgi:hypothetical protein